MRCHCVFKVELFRLISLADLQIISDHNHLTLSPPKSTFVRWMLWHSPYKSELWRRKGEGFVLDVQSSGQSLDAKYQTHFWRLLAANWFIKARLYSWRASSTTRERWIDVAHAVNPCSGSNLSRSMSCFCRCLYTRGLHLVNCRQ